MIYNQGRLVPKVPFALSSSEGRYSKASKETLVNLFTDNSATPNAKSQVVLVGTPGWDLRYTFPTSPILGMHYFNYILFVVTSTKLYKIDSNELVTEIGDVDFTLRDTVSIADNGVNIIIVGGNAYYSDGVIVSKITDPNYYPADTVVFLGGYFILNRSGTNQFFISRLYDVTFDATMYASAEGCPDNIAAVASDSRNLWLFGDTSIEVWYNSGDALFPFDRVQGAFSQRGCLSYKTISNINNTIYWVSDDGIVYMASGYTPTPISTEAIEYHISVRGNNDVTAFSYVEEGHYFYVLTISNTITLAYDSKTGLWHTRESLASTWGITDIVRSSKGILTGSDLTSGNIYYMGMDRFTENGLPILREAVTSPFSNGVDYMTVNSFELDMETGKSISNVDDMMSLSISSDGGVSWGNEREISLGKIGERKKRVVWRRLGRHRNITIKIKARCTSQINIIAAYADFQ